jgi:hypothetical protein
MKRILICLLSAASCGCAPMAVPVVKESLICNVPPELLQPCGEAAPVKEGITFGELVKLSGRDRQTLRQCAKDHQDLAGAVAKCKETIDRHNASIRDDEVK